MHNNDDDNRTSIQFVYNNDDEETENWSQLNNRDFEAHTDGLAKETIEPSSKLTHICINMCKYDNEDTQEEDVDMKTEIERKHDEEHQDQDMEIICDDHPDRTADLCFMNRTKNEAPVKRTHGSNTINNNNNTEEDQRTKDTEDQSTVTNETPTKLPNTKAKENDTPTSARTRSKTTKNIEEETQNNDDNKATLSDLNSFAGISVFFSSRTRN